MGISVNRLVFSAPILEKGWAKDGRRMGYEPLPA